jgi:aminopeptidase N
MKTIRRYYADFKFKHPTPNSILRSAEKVSGIELDWYLTDWTQTTNTIDYGISSVADVDGKARITMERIGQMPMPIDVLVVYKDGSQQTYYAPLRMMRGEKPNPYPSLPRTVVPDWPWAQPVYTIDLDVSVDQIDGIRIDPSGLMADVNQENNNWFAE